MGSRAVGGVWEPGREVTMTETRTPVAGQSDVRRAWASLLLFPFVFAYYYAAVVGR